MRVLLTGATGFVGSHVARLAVRLGHEVHVLVRRGSDVWRVRDILASLEVVPCDLLDSDRLGAHVAAFRPDLCVHLAWCTEPSRYLTSHENVELLTASIGLATRLARTGCRKLVVAGTCFEYDTSLGYLSEASATKPATLYAASKHALHFVLLALAAGTGMQVAWARLFYQYGPFERPERLVPTVIRALLGGERAPVTPGEQVRDYLHVEDVAAAVWAVAASDLSGAVNIGSGRPIAVREVVTAIGRLLERSDLIEFGARPYAPGDPMFVCADNRRLREGTAWRARYGLDDGLRATIAWWRERETAPGAVSHR